jgi:S1-C subfamily serine protease
VNLLDVVLLLAIASAVATGLRLGFLARTASWVGLIVGIGAATWTVPAALAAAVGTEPAVRLFVGLVTLALTVTVIATLFQAVGVRLRRTVARSTSLSVLDRGLGAIAGALAVLLVVWFLVPAASEVPGGIARQVRTSIVVDAVATAGPPPPDTVRALRNLVATSRFPEVFADLQPSPVTGPPPEEVPVDPSVVEQATASTVNVETTGCGRRYEGSGWAAADDLVVTNAHVVAGADEVAARRPDGTVRPATVVVFDADRDLAVLEVPDLGQSPLERAATEPGDLGVVIGYPGGQDTPRVAPVEIRERRAAVGRDIYGQDQTERRVVFLASQLQQGDSGSPVVDTDGRVGGVVFAISPDQPTSAFALDLEEVDAVLEAPRTPGETGPCI